jgi:group I intron endonuclease
MDYNIVSGVYMIENIKTNKKYIGSSKDIHKRWSEHKALLIKGKHHSIKLQRSYNKTKNKEIYVFSIIEIINDTNLLKEREQYWIDFYDSFKNGYNCSAVDNPSFTEKSERRKRKNDKIKILYQEF